jgi:hypothetical protein
MRVSRTENQHFTLGSGDAYKPMHDCSARLVFASFEDTADSERTLTMEQAVDSDHTLTMEPATEEAAQPTTDPITIADVVRTSIRGFLHAGRRPGRKATKEIMTLTCGSLGQEQKDTLAGLDTQEADSWDLKSKVYLSDVLEDGLISDVNVNKRGVKELLRIAEENERLDMDVRMCRKRFRRPETGKTFEYTKRMKDERDAFANRIRQAMERGALDPVAEEEIIDEVVDNTDDEGAGSDNEEEESDGFIVGDDEPLEVAEAAGAGEPVVDDEEDEEFYDDEEDDDDA